MILTEKKTVMNELNNTSGNLCYGSFWNGSAGFDSSHDLHNREDKAQEEGNFEKEGEHAYFVESYSCSKEYSISWMLLSSKTRVCYCGTLHKIIVKGPEIYPQTRQKNFFVENFEELEVFWFIFDDFQLAKGAVIDPIINEINVQGEEPNLQFAVWSGLQSQKYFWT